PDVEFDVRVKNTRALVLSTKRSELAIALNLALIKHERFSAYGTGGAFKEFTAQVLGLHWTRGYIYVNAGICLMKHREHLQSLAVCSVEALAKLARLDHDQMRAFLSKYRDLEAMSQQEIIQRAQAWLGSTKFSET